MVSIISALIVNLVAQVVIYFWLIYQPWSVLTYVSVVSFTFTFTANSTAASAETISTWASELWSSDTDKLVEKIVKRDRWPIQLDIPPPPLLRLTSRKPLWLDLQPVDIKSRWRHNWKSAQVVNSLVPSHSRLSLCDRCSSHTNESEQHTKE